jgi:eight-cysteine-cluster-containing protein
MRTSHLLAASVALLTPVVALAAFRDVPQTHPYANAITYVQSERIVSGYSDGTYRPNDSINRAEFTKIVIGSIVTGPDIEGCSKDDEGPALSDVPTNSWFVDYVCTARKRGIISGNPDGTFRPGNPINTAEAAKIVVKTFGFPVATQDTVWYRPYINVLKQKDALPAAAMDPGHTLTRGEMAEIIYRIKNPGVTDNEQPACVTSGCSGQLCVEEGDETVTTCEYRPEYACYKNAKCERQQDGQCGWTQSATLDACLKDPSQAQALGERVYTAFTQSVIGNGETSVLFFHAGWCPECRAEDANLTEWYSAGVPYAASTYKVNYDAETALKQKYGVTHQHTFVLIDGKGDKIRMATGPTEADLKNMLNGK